jgi:branched-chain amino acid aminotransferase
VWAEGRIVPADAPLWSGLDRGPLYGDGLFETLRSAGGVACDLDLHLERFHRSAVELGYPQPDVLSATGRQAVQELLAQVSQPAGVLRITWTRGKGERGYAPSPGMIATVTAHHFALPPDLEARSRGVRAMIAVGPFPGCLARHKSCSSLVYVEAARRASLAGADEALLEDDRGGVSEASAANLFALVDGVLVTPPLSVPVLPGITRGWVLERARSLPPDELANGDLGRAPLMGVEERPLTSDELRRATEAFLTSSVAGVIPLLAVDGDPVGEESPGPLTRTLQSELQARWASVKAPEPNPRGSP